MGKTYERIDGRLRDFIEAQPMFFVATAPLSGDGTVNLSPKGLRGCFAVLDEHTVAYLDFAGSNAETIAHLRENGRITLMWCAFTGPPNIVRVHGRGEPVFRDDPRWPGLLTHFPDIDPGPHGLRAIIVVRAELITVTFARFFRFSIKTASAFSVSANSTSVTCEQMPARSMAASTPELPPPTTATGLPL